MVGESAEQSTTFAFALFVVELRVQYCKSRFSMCMCKRRIEERRRLGGERKKSTRMPIHRSKLSNENPMKL